MALSTLDAHKDEAVFDVKAPVSADVLIEQKPLLFLELSIHIRRHDMESLREACAEYSMESLVQLTGRDGETLLHVAVEAGYLNIVKLIVEAGGDIHRLSPSGESPLMMSIFGGNVAMIEYMLACDAPINCGEALHAACQSEQIDVVKLLIARGLDVSTMSETGCTPLHVAASSGINEIIQLLVDHGADVNVLTNRGLSPLHLACQSANEHAVKLFLSLGATVDLTSASGSPFIEAVKVFGRNPAVYDLLLAAAASINFGHCDAQGMSALHHASRLGLKRVVRELIAFGCELNIADANGFTPLAHAIQCKSPAVILLLSRSGALYSGLSPQQRTTAFLLAAEHNSELLDVVVDWVDDVDEPKASGGRSALHLAATSGQHLAIRTLLSRNAKLIATPQGDLPLHFACKYGRAEAVAELVSHHGVLYTRNNNGQSPLALAVSSSQQPSTTRAVLGVSLSSALPDCSVCCANEGVYTLHACAHAVCVGCLNNWLEVQIKENRCGLLHVRCPLCPTQMAYEDVQKLTLDPQTLEFCERATLELCLNSQADYFWCPFCPSGGYGSFDDGCWDVHCSDCHGHFCRLCREGAHSGLTCEEFRESYEFQVGKWKAEHTKKCPTCKVTIEKNGGCPDMTCRQCKNHFCWNCCETMEAHRDQKKSYPCQK